MTGLLTQQSLTKPSLIAEAFSVLHVSPSAPHFSPDGCSWLDLLTFQKFSPFSESGWVNCCPHLSEVLFESPNNLN